MDASLRHVIMQIQIVDGFDTKFEVLEVEFEVWSLKLRRKEFFWNIPYDKGYNSCDTDSTHKNTHVCKKG